MRAAHPLLRGMPDRWLQVLSLPGEVHQKPRIAKRGLLAFTLPKHGQSHYAISAQLSPEGSKHRLLPSYLTATTPASPWHTEALLPNLFEPYFCSRRQQPSHS